jgi:hypothetical protein
LNTLVEAERKLAALTIEHGRVKGEHAFSFVCRLESRDEAALTEWRAVRVRSDLRSVERELYR